MKIIELLLFLTTIYNKYLSYKYYKKHIDYYAESRGNRYVKMWISVRYTDTSVYLTMLWSLYCLLYDTPPSEFTCLTWCLSCNVTIGYWLMRDRIIAKEIDTETVAYKMTNYTSHGLLPVLILIILPNYPYTMTHIYYPITFSFFWLLCVIYPWYWITGHALYSFVKKEIHIINKIFVITTILIINVFACYIGYIYSDLIRFIQTNHDSSFDSIL